MQVRAAVFRVIAGVCSRLPRMRGKNRAALAVFHAFGLQAKHMQVVARLRVPVPYVAQLDLHSWLQRLAYVSGAYEAATVTFLAKLRESMGGGYLLDIGANIGLISIPSAIMLRRAGAASPQVVAIEAVPDNAAALRRNVDLNMAGDWIRVIETALGEAPGTADIQVEGDLKKGEGTGTANILPADSRYECERVRIQIRTLDSLMASGEVPRGCSVVKIDTDGYDIKVLQGAQSFLAACRPVIFGEFASPCLAWHGQSLADVVTLATGIGYEVWRSTGTAGQFTRELAPETYVQDLLLVPAEAVQRMSWCLSP